MSKTMTNRRIVVGVDESEESIAALQWALHYAKLTKGLVEVFYVLEAPLPVPYSPTIRVPSLEIAEEARTELDGVIATQLRHGDDVRVTTAVIKGRPADVLVQAAEGAELLVLGSSGLSGIVGVLAGSTDYAVIHHAPCPLVLVPYQSESAGGAA